MKIEFEVIGQNPWKNHCVGKLVLPEKSPFGKMLGTIIKEDSGEYPNNPMEDRLTILFQNGAAGHYKRKECKLARDLRVWPEINQNIEKDEKRSSSGS